MPKEIEYHVRAVLAATFLMLGTAQWFPNHHYRFWSDLCGSMFLYYIAAMCVMGWREPTEQWAELIVALDTMIKRLHHMFNGKDMEVREQQAEEREKQDG